MSIEHEAKRILKRQEAVEKFNRKHGSDGRFASGGGGKGGGGGKWRDPMEAESKAFMAEGKQATIPKKVGTSGTQSAAGLKAPKKPSDADYDRWSPKQPSSGERMTPKQIKDLHASEKATYPKGKAAKAAAGRDTRGVGGGPRPEGNDYKSRKSLDEGTGTKPYGKDYKSMSLDSGTLGGGVKKPPQISNAARRMRQPEATSLPAKVNIPKGRGTDVTFRAAQAKRKAAGKAPLMRSKFKG